MAPLSLPEIASYDISAPRRAALVADLPAESLNGVAPHSSERLCEFLRRGADKDVWLAVIELMSRSGSTAWTESWRMPSSTPKLARFWMDERFWARMILIVHRMVQNAPELCEQLRPFEESCRRMLQGTSCAPWSEGDDRQYLPARSRFHEIARSRTTEPEQLGLR